MSDDPSLKTVTSALVIIGNEILSGRTKDANLAYLGEELNKLGIRMMECRVVADIPDAIVGAVNDMRARYDYVFTTGGIGPTHDDITSECIAQAFELPFGPNPEAVAILDDYYRPEDRTEARYRMAKTPEGAILIENPVSKAPGFQVENVFVLPGVPRIMQAMFGGIRHRLVGGQPMVSRTITSQVPEGKAGGGLGEIQAQYPDTEIGSYPFFRDGKPGANVFVRAQDAERVDDVVQKVIELLVSLGGKPKVDD